MDKSQEMTTPLNRFFTFWWILAGFAAFGVLSLIAYAIGGKKGDAVYEKAMETRLATKAEVAVEQVKQLESIKLDLAAGAAALSKQTASASDKAVPGSPTFDALMADMAAKQEAEDAAKAAAEAAANPDAAPTAEATKLTLTATNSAKEPSLALQYVEKELTATAGVPIELTFSNPDVQMHNVVICKIGTDGDTAAKAMAMAADPEAMAKGYVPATDNIIAASKLLTVGQRDVIKFTIDEPGDYPYLCTFPGHYILMKGVLKITPAK